MSGTGRRSGINPLIAGLLAGILIAFVVGVMADINVQYGAPWARAHILGAQVTDADGITVGSDVRIAGRLVGQITSVNAAGDHTDLVFQVNPEDWPLKADTTASIRLATLLGQKYLQLNPGHGSQTMAEGAVMGVHSVRPVVDFDQILDTFDQPTRDSLTRLIRTLAGGVQGQEGTLQQLAPDLADLSVHSQVPTGELVARDAEINNILANLATSADQLNASSDDLAGVFTNLNSITGALASNNGSGLKSFIKNMDELNISTDAVLGRGAATTLANGLQKLPTFVKSFGANCPGGVKLDPCDLLSRLIPQTTTATMPLTFNGISCSTPATPGQLCDPADLLPNNPRGIPINAAIDLIYEIGSATSQGYQFQDFGSGTHPDLQGNFFLRQFGAGSDPCSQRNTAHTVVCMDFDLGQPASSAAAAPAAAAPPSPIAPPAPSVCNPLFVCSPNRPGPTPTPAPTSAPAPSPSLQPAPPTPTPTPAPSPTLQTSPPSPTPIASGTGSAAQLSSTAFAIPATSPSGTPGAAEADFWNAFFSNAGVLDLFVNDASWWLRYR